MAVGCKTYLVTLGIIFLCFFGIPIRIKNNEVVQDNSILFRSYVINFNKTYSTNSSEYENRFNRFKDSLQLINELNSARPSSLSATYGLTKYSDMSKDEFMRHHLQPKLHEHIEHRKSRHNKKYNNHQKNVVKKKRSVDEAIPEKMDWRDKKVISEVKNQKTCGACWAFSTVETVESMIAIKTGTLKSLSVQEVIDCAQNGNLGCNGGDTCSLLDWLTINQIPIETDKEYPMNWQTGTCKLKGSEPGVKVAGNFTCESFVGRESSLISMLANHGPVAVAINAINWQNYLGGIIQFHCDGNPAMLNHAVQIVGFDNSSPIPHYIVRNSWGTDFGDEGYLYIAIGNNLCGLATEVAALDVIV